jgi:hypothetical protein
MVLVVLISLLSVVTMLIGLEMTIKPPTDKSKWRYRAAFVFIGVLTIILAICQSKEQERSDAATSNTLGAIQTNTEKPSFQLFVNSFTDKRSDHYETNFSTGVISHVVTIDRTPRIDGLSMGSIIDLKQSRDVSLSVTTFGDLPAEQFTLQIMTPWANPNITGDSGWVELGLENMLDAATKTFTPAHAMSLEFAHPLPPMQSVPLPTLHVPTNYPNSDLTIRFKMFSDNSKAQEVGVVFRLR